MKRPVVLDRTQARNPEARREIAGRRGYGICLAALIAGGLAWWRWRAPVRSAPPAAVAPAAERRLIEAAAREPGSAAAHGALGRYYLQAGQPFEAIWELDQAGVLAPRARDTRPTPTAGPERVMNRWPKTFFPLKSSPTRSAMR